MIGDYDPNAVAKERLLGTAGYVSQIDTQDTTSTLATKFNTTHAQFPCPTDSTRDNHVVCMGWNKNPGGGPENPNDDAFGLHFEQYWSQSVGHGFLEFHLDWWRKENATSYRPYTMTMDRNGGFIDSGWNVHKMSWFDPETQAQRMVYTPNWLAFMGTMTFRHNTNNVVFLTQLNAAQTAYTSLLYLDNSDRVVIGPSAGTQLRVGTGKADLKAGSVYAVGGTQVVGPRGAAIPDPVTIDDVIANQIAILSAMRLHGLIAT